jgi:3-hydroxybutyryl-CoA dehydrogenase
MHEIKKIGIVGEGKMGTSIFLFLNGFNFQLTWLCSSDLEKDKAQKTVNKKTKLLFQCGVISEQEYILKTGLTKVTAFIDDLHDCDLIIETITEDIELKRKLFCSLNSVIKQECILTTNSSSIIPSLLVPSENRKDKFMGLHFFFPVPVKNIVELIVSSSTSSETKELLQSFILQIKKQPFIQTEEHAFILNKLFLDFQADAFNIFKEGQLSYKEIDEIVKEHLFPIGVFEFFDHVGIDIMLSSIKAYSQNSKNIEFYYPLIKKMEELISENKLGLKSKIGFYDYRNGQSECIVNRFNVSVNEDVRQNVLNRLKNIFNLSVQKIIDLKICSVEELKYAVKDYMGIDHDPFPSNM